MGERVTAETNNKTWEKNKAINKLITGFNKLIILLC